MDNRKITDSAGQTAWNFQSEVAFGEVCIGPGRDSSVGATGRVSDRGGWSEKHYGDAAAGINPL